MANDNAGAKGERRASLIEAAVAVPNLILLVVLVLYLALTGAGTKTVEPLLKTDRDTAGRIAALENKLRHDPQARGGTALELARLYSRVGEFPWSLDALRSAERKGGQRPAWKMKLGLAYLELGKNVDGLRVLKDALQGCEKEACPAHIKGKLQIFTRAAELLIERGIDARTNQRAAAKVFEEVLKPGKAIAGQLAAGAAAPPKGGSEKRTPPTSAPTSSSN